MAWTYAQAWAGLHDGGATASQINAQIAGAIADASYTVYNEVGTTPGHTARAAYATKILNAGVENAAKTMGIAIALAMSAGGAAFPPADSDVKTAVLLVWNMFAGA